MAPLSKLYVTPLDGLVTLIVPVAVAHVGSVTVVVGTEGGVGWASMMAVAVADVQPPTAFFTLMS